ncbi:hypothetical protein FBU59_002815 [Linderina macrospora]|uniref:Uncharacterized protein n=1 Tax=Linderina macrospora TaxID=4868 RepID=A0ACC1JAC7_9FUNG|nr:hypothetical protein FBU59_002815 [Linderina macrospora]
MSSQITAAYTNANDSSKAFAVTSAEFSDIKGLVNALQATQTDVNTRLTELVDAEKARKAELLEKDEPKRQKAN